MVLKTAEKIPKMTIVVVVLCCAAGLLLLLFNPVQDYFAIRTERMFPSVQVNWIDKAPPKTVSKLVPPLCADAKVKWTFKCETEMNYSYIEKQKMGNRWYVTIRIEGVYAKLSLPIEITLPHKPPVRLNQHDEGHVIICKRVFEDAENYARAAITPILKRNYSGEGDTVDEACAQCVRLANDEMVESYTLKTQGVVQDVSDIYDFLELKPDASYEKSVEQAFKIYQAGKSRRL